MISARVSTLNVIPERLSHQGIKKCPLSALQKLCHDSIRSQRKPPLNIMSYDEIPPVLNDLPAPAGSPDFDDDEATSNCLWRLAAVVGVVAAIVIAASNSFPLDPRQSRLFLFAACPAIAAWLVLHFVFSGPWRRFRRQWDLLVPIGVVAGVAQLLEVLARMPLLDRLSNRNGRFDWLVCR